MDEVERVWNSPAGWGTEGLMNEIDEPCVKCWASVCNRQGFRSQKKSKAGCCLRKKRFVSQQHWQGEQCALLTGCSEGLQGRRRHHFYPQEQPGIGNLRTHHKIQNVSAKQLPWNNRAEVGHEANRGCIIEIHLYHVLKIQMSHKEVQIFLVLLKNQKF